MEFGCWIIAATSLTVSYPCRCAGRKYSRCSPKFCPCSGRVDPPDDSCCASRLPDDRAVLVLADAATQSFEAVPQVASVEPLESYRRRWAHGDLHCDCATPWDGQSRPGGVHCTNCHDQFANVALYMLHFRGMACRSLGKVRDVGTGRVLFRLRDGVWVQV